MKASDVQNYPRYYCQFSYFKPLCCLCGMTPSSQSVSQSVRKERDSSNGDRRNSSNGCKLVTGEMVKLMIS